MSNGTMKLLHVKNAMKFNDSIQACTVQHFKHSAVNEHLVMKAILVLPNHAQRWL